jgi:S-formylglutathione hydrolase FrmB
MAGKPVRYAVRYLACAAALAAAPPLFAPARAEPESEQARAEALTYIGEVQLSPRLREITLMTPALATPAFGPIPANPTGRTKLRVLLPEGYDPKAAARYPVLYLFHGGGENEAAWTTPTEKGKAEELTKGLPLIVVMPDGGVAGGYSDWYNGGAFGPPQWKTYHLDQLIPWIDTHFRTIADRGGRATAGLSMGGGGLRYAALRPDLIGATAAFSGDIDILQPASDWNGMGAPISRMIWGDRKTEEVRWRGANGPDLAGNLGNTDVAIFAGDTGRPEATYILPGSTVVHDRLNELGIAHQFIVYPGMTHSWPTWNRALAEWLPRLMGRFHAFNPGNALLAGWATPSGRSLAAHPVAFSYSTIEPSYSLYGWSVRMDRKAVEFSALEVAGRSDLTLIGSGRAVVGTPAVAKANRPVRVAITNRDHPGLSRTVTLRTDRHGQLSVPVELGPPNPVQQYSSEAASAASSARSGEGLPFEVDDNESRFYHVSIRIDAQ